MSGWSSYFSAACKQTRPSVVNRMRWGKEQQENTELSLLCLLCFVHLKCLWRDTGEFQQLCENPIHFDRIKRHGNRKLWGVLVFNALHSPAHAGILVRRSDDSSAWWEAFFSQQHYCDIKEKIPHCVAEVRGCSSYLSANLVLTHSTALVEGKIFAFLSKSTWSLQPFWKLRGF